jgi:hypothetical protein
MVVIDLYNKVVKKLPYYTKQPDNQHYMLIWSVVTHILELSGFLIVFVMIRIINSVYYGLIS